MKKRSVNPAMAMMAARAMRTPAIARPTVNPMAAAQAPVMPGMKKGGKTMKSDAKEDTKMDVAQDKAMIKKAFKQHDMQEHKGGKGTKLSLCKGGKAYAKGGRLASKGEHAVQKQSKRGATMVKMARGGGCEIRGKTKGKMV